MKASIVAKVLAGVGAATLLVGVAGAIYGIGVVSRGFSTREPSSAMEAVMARALRSLSIPKRMKALANPVAMNAATLAEARAHWADHCATCHANNGSGETVLGNNMYPRAPDMRLADTQRLSDGELYAIIKNGVRLTGMPGWGDPGDDDRDSWTLVGLIRHLPKLSREELEEMKSLNPKSAHELHERQEEESFLNEGQ